MWSLNRDSTCGPPLPSVLPVVQTGCSGIDQGAQRFANVLATNLVSPSMSTLPSPSSNGRTVPTSAPTPETADDPATSPFPIWDSLGRYPAGTKVVWHQQVFKARYWTTGFTPDTSVANVKNSRGPSWVRCCPATPLPRCPPFLPGRIPSGTPPRPTSRVRACSSGSCPTKPSGGHRNKNPASLLPAAPRGSSSYRAPDEGMNVSLGP